MIFARVSSFLARALRLARLGAGLADNVHLFAAYVWLSVKRSLGLRYALSADRRFSMRFLGTSVPVHYRNLIDFYILEGLFVHEEYALDLPHAPRVIFDLGANTGLSTLYFKLRYPEAVIYAFEPDPTNAGIFLKNTERFQEDVHFIPVAVVGEASPVIEFYIAPEHWSSSLTGRIGGSRKIHVGALTLDQALAQFGVAKLDLLKFDIEGAEWEVFRHFKGLELVQSLVGEVHGDLMGVSKDEFYKLFDEFDIAQKDAHYLSDRVPVVIQRRAA